MTDYQKGKEHFNKGKSITGMVSLTTDFINGYQDGERHYKFENQYAKFGKTHKDFKKLPYNFRQPLV